MKRFVLLLAVFLMSVCGFAQGIQAGPWVTDASDSTLTILWTSEVPGLAYVELEDGRAVYDVFAGRRVFRRLHSITLKGLQRGQTVKYRVCGVIIKDDSNARDPKFGDAYQGSWLQTHTLDSQASS